ncbi:helix-turn-helix domain-containing protein [Maritimibacter sp. DP1N21-5]|nr:helix-turn-helix domain-containing protein [Maritimibacter sp. DP1N21-5]
MNHPVDVHIGKTIRAARQGVGMTQHELAQRIGVKFQQLQKYETATNRVSGSRIWMIANALNLSVADFFPDPSSKSDEAGNGQSSESRDHSKSANAAETLAAAD